MPTEKVQSSEKPKRLFQWSWHHFQVFTWMAHVPAITHNGDIGLTFRVDMDQLETISWDIDLLLRDSPSSHVFYGKCHSRTLRKTEELLSSISPDGTHEHSEGRKCEDPGHEFWVRGGWEEPPIKVVKADAAANERSPSPFGSVCGVHLHEEKRRFVQDAKTLYCFFLPLEYNAATPTKYWGAVYGLVKVSNPMLHLNQASLTE